MRTKINNLLLSGAMALCSAGAMAQGLENIVVEQYHTLTAADAAYYNGIGNGSYTLAAGDKCYRVYVDMLPGYKLNRVFGAPETFPGSGISNNPLDFTTTSTFFNDDFFVATQYPGQTRRIDEGLQFDSYLTISRSGALFAGAAGCGSAVEVLGVPRGAEDTDGDLTTCGNYPGFTGTDGNIPGTVPDVTGFIGMGLSSFQAFTGNASSFTLINNAWSTLPASQGPTAANRVLIGQFTTGGTFSFHINVELADPSSNLETYVWNQAGVGEQVSPLLTYPVPCTPAAISSTSNNSPICATDVLTLGVVATGTAPLTFLWTGTGTITNGGTANASVTGAATGNYNIAVSNACGNANQNVAVVVNATTTWYQDADVDGSGDPAVTLQACTQPVGYVSNSNDLCPADPNKIAPGQCGCGVADTDTDADGVANCNDNCPSVPGQIGSSCNDGNALTINDVLNASCVCAGTPVACVVNGDCNDSNACTSDACVSNVCVYTPITTDTDGDGTPDCADNCPTVVGQIGSTCDDGNALTINDVLNASCVCAGTPVSCVVNGDCNDSNACTSDACVSNVCVYTPITTDTDGDGTPDCADNCPTVVGQIGSTCDDGNALTINDVLNASCVCAGTPVSCVVNGDCNDSNACTSDACVSNVCVYTPITTDTDGDGTPDCADNCPTVVGQIGSTCDDGNALTINDVLNASCVCAGTPVSCVVNGDCNDSNACTSDACVSNVCVYTPITTDTDGDGTPDCADNCPTVVGQIGSTCDDGNALTINDVLNASCVCAGTPVSCVVNGDCNDSNACTSDACVSNVCVYTPITTDTDGDGTPDCADNCPTVVGQIGSTCDDGNPCTINDVLDAGCLCAGTLDNTDTDGDGVPNCSDNCPTVVGQIGSTCDDGNAFTINDVLNASCVCVGTPIGGCTEILTFEITLDNFGSQNTVELRDQTGTTVLDASGPYADGIGGTTVSDQFCVNPGCYRLVVKDTGNDGIAGGGYKLKNAAGKRIIDANGLFTDSSSVINEFCVAISNQGVYTSSCDRTDLLPSTQVYCLSQPGATGYQFWWFDPHGSYSRRILRPVPNMKPNMCISNPIPFGLDLNVRVRAQVGGSYTAFGPACRARVNATGGGAIVDGTDYQNAIAEVEAGSLELYPNPNRDGMVNLLLSGLSGEAHVVTIDVHDMYGKRVRTEQVTVEGDEFNHVLDLGGDLANGMYMVSVTSIDRVLMQRLIKQ